MMKNSNDYELLRRLKTLDDDGVVIATSDKLQLIRVEILVHIKRAYVINRTILVALKQLFNLVK